MGRSGGSPHCIVAVATQRRASVSAAVIITRNLPLCTVIVQLSLFFPLFVLLLLLFFFFSSSSSSSSSSSFFSFFLFLLFLLFLFFLFFFLFLLFFFLLSCVVLYIVIPRKEGEDSNLLKSFTVSFGK
jgi:predicted membrane protein